MEPTSRPYAAVPPEAAAVLRPALPGLADEMIAAIAREVPDYARAMEGEFGQVVRLGVEVALNRFVDLLADPEPDAAESRRTYVDLGRGEFHAGRSLDALLAAYRVGARLAWRRFVEAGVRGRARPGRDLRARRGDLRLHRRAVGGVGRGLCGGADRRGGRERAPPAAAGAAAGAGPARRAGGGADGRGRGRLDAAARRPGRARGGDRGRRRARRGAARLDRRAARAAARRGSAPPRSRGAIGAEAFGAAIVFVPDPDAPAAAAGSRRRSTTARPRWARRSSGRTARRAPAARSRPSAWPRPASSARRSARPA